MDRTLLKTLLVYTFILFGMYLLGKILLPFLSPIAWAVVIGIITFPAYSRLLELAGGSEWKAAAVMTLAVMLLFVLPVVALISVLAQEVSAVYKHTGAALSSGTAAEMMQRLESHPQFSPIIEKLNAFTDLGKFNIAENVMANSKAALSRILGFLTSILANSFGFLMDMVFMLFILFFVYHDADRALKWFERKVPVDPLLRIRIFGVIKNILSGFIFGTLLTCLVQGVLAGIAYWLFGIPSPLLLSVLTAIVGLIPVTGTAIIWLPAAAYLYLKGSVAKSVILILWGILVVGMSDNVVKPVFMSNMVTLPVLPLMIGAFGGLAAFGILGAILGPLLLAVLYELYIVEPLPESGGDTSAVT